MPTINYKLKDGTRVPGTTTIISTNLGWNKQPLMYWAWQQGMDGKNFRETTDKAADAGTLGHYLIECHLKGIITDTYRYDQELIEKAETSLINFLQWEDMVRFTVVETETHLVSEEYRYGATPDCIATIKGRRCLFDWKTGSGTYPDHLIQLEAYRHAWDECNPGRPIEDGFYILRIDKETAGFDWKYRHEVPEAWEAFKHLLALHKLQKKIK